MIKSKLTFVCLLLLTYAQTYYGCGLGCLQCESQQTQSICRVCDEHNHFFLRNGSCFKNYDKFCTKYEQNGNCFQCSNNRAPNQSNPLICTKLSKNEKVQFCKEYSAPNVCALCGYEKFLNGLNFCQDIDTYIEHCKYYQSSNTCQECQNNFHLSVDRKACIKSKVDEQCAVQQNLQCLKCKNEYYKVDQSSYTNLDDTFLSYYLSQIFFLQNTCEQILNKVDKCESYDENQNCVLCQVGYFLHTDPIVQCKSIEEDQSSNLIENCVQLQTQETCYKCAQNFHPSLDRSHCIAISRQNDCVVYSNTLNGSQPFCVQCSPQYFLRQNNTCQIRNNYLIEGCEEYSPYKDECISCGQNQLSINKDYCIQHIQNCYQYQLKNPDLSISKCEICQDPYISQDGICIQGTILNCAIYDQQTRECLKCKNEYYLKLDNSQQQECVQQPFVEHCDQYYENLQEIQQFSCQTCKTGYLLQNITNKCVEMTTQNCQEENQAGQCIQCKEGYQKVSKNGKYECIENLTENLEEVCQQKEVFMNHLGWEDYDNHHCNICNENYVPRYLLGQCVPEHIASMRQNFVEGCISFDDQMQCQLCEESKVLYQNQCLQECPSSTVFHKNYIDIQVKDQERNFKLQKNICIDKVFYEDEYLVNCDIRTRRAYSLLDIINREYCQKCDDSSVATIGHSFYRINLVNSQFEENKPYDEFLPLIKCQIPQNPFQNVENCEYYGELNEFDNRLVCKRCKHGFRENHNLPFTEEHIEQACDQLDGSNCLSCKEGYYMKYFDSIGGNGCYLPKDYYQDCSEQISECLVDTYQQVPGDLVQLMSCQKCSNGKVPVVGVRQLLVQNSQFVYEFSNYLFQHQALPQTNNMIECVDISEINTQFNIDSQELDINNANGFQNCAIFGISRAFENTQNNGLHCLACKPGYHTPNKPFRSDMCQPIQNCEIAGNKVNTCEKLQDNYYWGVQEQFYEMPNKVYYSVDMDKNCAVTFQNRGCIVCKKGYEMDESLQCVQVSNKNCIESNYNMPTLYLERNQINLLTFMQTSDFGFGCYQCQNGFVAFNEGFRKQCIDNVQYRYDNRFNPLIDQGVQEIVFVQHCLQYQLQDNIQDQLIRGNDCIKCQESKNLNTDLNQCEQIGTFIQFCQYYVNGQCVQCQQGKYYLMNGQCHESTEIENCIQYSDQYTCTKCQNSQNQQYELINNQCQPKYLCTDQYITTDYASVANNFFNGIKCDQEFANLNVKKFEALDSGLEVLQCQDQYKVETSFVQQCLQHTAIQNCTLYDQQRQRHLVFDLQPQCIQCENSYYLDSNRCMVRNNTQNCKEFELNSDKCKNCENLYFLNNGSCLSVSDSNCIESQPNQNSCSKCREEYILNSNSHCEKYHFHIENCVKYSPYNRYCQECDDIYYLSVDNLSCILRQNYPIQNCDKYSLNQQICQSCQDGHFLNDNFMECLEIQTFVENCERPLTLEQCHECQPGYYLQNSQTQCDAIQYHLENCSRYINQENCYECKNNAQLYDNKCYIPDQNNCLKYQDGICEICASGYSYDSQTNTCEEDNYEQFCQQCSGKKNPKCTQHCSYVDNCQKMTWYGKCEQCVQNYILSYDQRRCYYNSYDVGCEQLVEVEPFCRTCKNGFREYTTDNETLCFEDESSNCVQRDINGKCQMCKSGSYQTTDGVCQNYQVQSDEQSQEEDSESSQSSKTQSKKVKRLQFILKRLLKNYFFSQIKRILLCQQQ